MQRLILILAVFSFSGFITACGNSSFVSAGRKASCDNCTLEIPGPEEGINQPLEQVEFDGKLDDGSSFFEIDPATEKLIVKFPLDFTGLFDQFPLYININLSPLVEELEGVAISMTQDAVSKKSVLRIEVPLELLLGDKASGALDYRGLPNGDPLPYVASGILPSVATEIENVETTFYVGLGKIGLFVNSPFDMYVGIMKALKNTSGQTLGHIGTIPLKYQQNGQKHKGGFYLMLQLPDDLAQELDKIIRPPGSNL